MELRSKTKPTMKPSKFYAVANGRINGVFNNVWDESRLLTDFYPRARHKGFDETEHAWKFILNENKAIPTPASLNEYRTLTNIDIQNLREQMERDEKVSSVKNRLIMRLVNQIGLVLTISALILLKTVRFQFQSGSLLKFWINA